eukprot:6651056-Pyramimonas_sp.AAC.1
MSIRRPCESRGPVPPHRRRPGAQASPPAVPSYIGQSSNDVSEEVGRGGQGQAETTALTMALKL